jgi:CheY-like chemotaxis protein
MNKKGEIILIEDDADDKELFLEAYRELAIRNKLTVFDNANEAYKYFNNTKKDLFLIISDINMPVMTGIELRDKMQQLGEVKLRTIPFLFLTTGTATDNVIYSYSHSVQGFFLKPTYFDNLKTTLRHIIDYWTTCTEPSFSNKPPERF